MTQRAKSPDGVRVPAEVWTGEPSAALRALASTESGLAAAEATRRLERFGFNELPQPPRTSSLLLLLRQFRSPLIYLLLAAGLVSLLLEEFIDAGAIAAVLVFNAAIGFTQELRATRELEALARLAPNRAMVLRDRREIDIEARFLVPGDVVLIGAGSRVPADLRVLHAAALEADESLLTGESTPVAKHARGSAGAGARTDPNALIAGSAVTRGRARALVVATGEHTELGRIAGSVAESEQAETPLQRRMAGLAQTIGFAVFAASAVGFVAGAARGVSIYELLLTLVALAVSAIPEGLPIVLTITLAVGVRRMASRHALVRRLPAVETLGSCTIIGSDKTGTLTQNRMTVCEIWTGRERFEVTGSGYGIAGAFRNADGEDIDPAAHPTLRETLRAGVLCNEASIVRSDGEYDGYGDPTEIALLIVGAKAGLERAALETAFPRVSEIPFDSEAKFAATISQDQQHRRLPASPGSVDDATDQVKLGTDRLMALHGSPSPPVIGGLHHRYRWVA